MKQHSREKTALGLRFALGLLVATVLLGAQFAGPSYALTEAEKYLEQIKIYNEVLSEVQKKYVDQEKVTTEDLIRESIEGMLGSLDPHSSFLPPKQYDEFREDTRGTFGGLGITIDIRDGWLTVVSPLPDTPAFKAGLLPGDKIIKIEGETTENMKIQEAVERLRGEPGTKVRITVFRLKDRSTEDYTITRDIIRIPNLYVYTINDRFGYIRLLEFKQTASRDLNMAFEMLEEKDVEGLILDLRFNSGGLLDMAVEVSDKFLPKGKRIVSIRGRDEEDEKVYAARSRVEMELPLVVLVNQASASASEIVAGAIQDWGRGIVVGPVGQRTFGKGSVQTVIPMQDGSALKLTTAKYFTPAGRSIQDENGIDPDVKVDLDDEDLREMISLGRLGYLPERIADVQQIYPPMIEEEEEGTEETGKAPEEEPTPVEDSEAAVDEEEEDLPSMPGLAVEAEQEAGADDYPDVYDKELAKGFEILKALTIYKTTAELLD